MDSKEIGAHHFKMFAISCTARRERIATLLDAFHAGDLGVRETLESIAVELHDLIGDARLISLEEVSKAAIDLEKLVHAWRDQLLPTAEAESLDDVLVRAVHSQNFRSWLERLTDLSKKFALTVGDDGQVAELEELRVELRKALGDTNYAVDGGGGDGGQTSNSLRALGHKRVLLVDDSPIVRDLLAAMLERMGHSVASAQSAEEFWKLQAEQQPDLVFMDMNMPDVKGDELCRQLRRKHDGKQLHVIIFSSLSGTKLAEAAEQAGADGYFSKQKGFEGLREYLVQLGEQGIL